MSDYEFWNELENIFEAVTAYQKKSIEFNRTFISPWVRLGHVFPREACSQKDLQTTLHAAELDPQNPQVWMDLGDMFLHLENLEEAADSYRKAVELDSGPVSKSKLAHILAAQGKYQDAIPLYSESLPHLTDDRDKAVIWNRLGEAYRKLGDFENAVSAFLKADELETARPDGQDSPDESMEPETEETSAVPDREPVTDTAGEIPEVEADGPWTKPGLFPTDLPLASDNAVATCDRQIPPPVEQTGDAVFSSEFERHLLLNFGNSQAVREEEARLETTDSDTPSESIRSAPVAWSDWPEEIPADISPLAAAEEDAPNMLFRLEEDARIDRPVNLQAEADASDPSVEGIHDEPAQGDLIGESAFEEYLEDLFRPAQTAGAEAEKTPAVAPAAVADDSGNESGGPEPDRLDPDSRNPQVWNELGTVYFNAGAFDNAIMAYKQAIELDPQFAWAYNNLALAYAQKDCFDEAVLLYKRSIELFQTAKEKAIAWNRLGNLYRHHQRFDEAIAAYQAADELDPESVSLALRSRFSLLGDLPMEEPAYL